MAKGMTIEQKIEVMMNLTEHSITTKKQTPKRLEKFGHATQLAKMIGFNEGLKWTLDELKKVPDGK